MPDLRRVSRRAFVVGGTAAGAGLILAIHLAQRLSPRLPCPKGSFAPNVWLQVTPDETVTIWVARSEMGQGIRTSLPMLVAEELEADWTKIRIEPALADWVYGSQETSGSLSIRSNWEPLRRAGAAAREMLTRAAAQAWGVDRATCRAENGAVIHLPTGRRLSYGRLAEAAARLPVPKDVPLKQPEDFRILGQPLRRLDTPSKVDGSASFGLDVRLPHMLWGNVLRCPVFGGVVRSFDAAGAKSVPGVYDVLRIRSGVAVLANSTWAAWEGRRALRVEWDEGPNASLSSASISRLYHQLADQPGAVARKEGDPADAFARAARRLEADYQVPFLTHVTMEPMNLTADVHWDRCEIWAPTQNPSRMRQEAARLCWLPDRRVVVHTMLLGGGFGRRLEFDMMFDAIELSRAVRRPVQVVWTRDDDIQHGFYRPAALSRMRAALDPQGRLVGWTHRCVSPSIRARFGRLVNGMDNMAVEGASDVPYAIPNLLVDYVQADLPVPVGNWRSVSRSQNCFAVECFLDEIAAASRRDPLELRLSLLGHAPRPRAVLELAASKAGWGTPLPKGRARGIALNAGYGSYLAQVAEAVVNDNGSIAVPRVVCALDCGTIINPDTLVAQMEGGVAFGLSAALKEEITLEKGRVVQSNFHDYDVLRIGQMPAVEVHLLPNREPPGGVGELAIPPVAPAVANAIFAATGKRIRRLPIRAEGFLPA